MNIITGHVPDLNGVTFRELLDEMELVTFVHQNSSQTTPKALAFITLPVVCRGGGHENRDVPRCAAVPEHGTTMYA